MRSAPEAPSTSSAFRLQEIRQPLALNHFKKAVLGARHRPGEPQAAEVRRAFSGVGMDGCLDPRTWSGWFNDPPRRARRDAVANLDRYFDRTRQLSRTQTSSPIAPSPTFYVDLIEAGLVERLVRKTNAKPPIKALLYRAFEYQPASASHLHVDAIECAALWFEGGEVTCDDLKAIAANRVLELIYERWRPRQGSIYKELSSSLKLQWDSSDDQAREGILQSFAKLIPDRFEVRMHEAPSPDWMGIGVSEDFAPNDIQKVLLLLAADTTFLVADRFDAWVIDLVSAGIAAYAVAQTNPCAWEPFGLSPTCKYWDAIHALFFDDERDIDVEEQFEMPFLLAGGEFTEGTMRNLLAARVRYWAWLENLGLSARKIADLSGFGSLYPNVFRGGT